MAGLIWLGLIAAGTFLAYRLLRLAPRVIDVIGRGMERRQQRRERLELIARTEELLTLLTFDDRLAEAVHAGLGRHIDGDQYFWLGEEGS